MPKSNNSRKRNVQSKKKVLEIDYMEMNKCCTAKLSPNFSSSWASIATVTYSITGVLKG